MALEKVYSVLEVFLITVLVVEGIAVAQKTQGGQNFGGNRMATTQCSDWVRTSNGGQFASPNFPNFYPPNQECLFILEAAPRQRIELTFDEPYNIEPSFECRFDHLEVRDGPFGFSPLIDRYCGQKSPTLIRSTGRFMWIKFTSDEEIEGMGFKAKYSFIPDPDFTYLGGILNPIPDCQFELSGADGIVRSSQVEQDDKTKPGQAVDCIWTIKATPNAKIPLKNIRPTFSKVLCSTPFRRGLHKSLHYGHQHCFPRSPTQIKAHQWTHATFHIGNQRQIHLWTLLIYFISGLPGCLSRALLRLPLLANT